MIDTLYDIFKHWSENGAVYLYSDPHFGDLDSYKKRCKLAISIIRSGEGDYLNPTLLLFSQAFHQYLDGELTAEDFVRTLDDIQIKNINKKCGRNDTLVILGDVSNKDNIEYGIECVKKLKAGYKVLIMGNHDLGASNYKKVIDFKIVNPALIDCNKFDVYDLRVPCGIQKDVYYADIARTANVTTKMVYEAARVGLKENRTTVVFESNKLPFDEVYQGSLQIAPNIKLSHEHDDSIYALNIHGHHHGDCGFNRKRLYGYYTSMDFNDELPYVFHYYNVIAEALNYSPINLADIIKSGILKNIKNIHRATIDNATERKNRKNGVIATPVATPAPNYEKKN